MASDEWVECKLADACASIDYGLTASASETPVGPRFLRITDIVRDTIDWESVPYAATDEATLERYRLADGDIVLARTGASTGTSAYIKEPPLAIFASYLVRLKVKPEFESRLLAYYLKSESFWSFIRGVLGDKSAQPNASASTMTQAPLRLPKNVEKQRAIAHILGTLDDKIELNHRTNETLEALARAIFKSWFVDFDPVRAKASGEPSEAICRRFWLTPELLALFPDRFQESELGEIPEGWEVKSLNDCADYINGLAFRNEHFSQNRSSSPVIKIGELKDGVTEQTKFTEVIFDDKYRVMSGDILFSWSGSPDTSIDTFVWVGSAGWLNQHIFKIAFKQEVEKYFVYYLLRYLRPEFVEIARNKQTTGLGHVTVQDLKRLKVAFPRDSVLRGFNPLAEPVFKKIYKNNWESNTLAVLRDTLLPKLLSGELSVPLESPDA